MPYCTSGGECVAGFEIIAGYVIIALGIRMINDYDIYYIYGYSTKSSVVASIAVFAGIMIIFFGLVLLVGILKRSICLLTTWLVYRYLFLGIHFLIFLDSVFWTLGDSSKRVEDDQRTVLRILIPIIFIAIVHHIRYQLNSEMQNDDRQPPVTTTATTTV